MNKTSFVGRRLANAIYANVSSAEIDAKKAPFSLIDGSLPKYIDVIDPPFPEILRVEL